MIFKYEIFDEENFETFVELVKCKNAHVEASFIVDMFEEVRIYLNEQFTNIENDQQEENE